MKRIVLMLGVVAVIALASCSKEKDCVCTTSYSGPGSEMFPDQSTEMTTKEECSDSDSSTASGDMTMSITCVEK